MSVQVLVATMYQNDHSLLDKMNIQTDAIVGNQCDRNEIEEFEYNGHKIKYLSFAERGVGLNRNNALMRANADICLFADDDMTFYNNYEKIVYEAFLANKNADIIIFNIDDNKNLGRRVNKKTKKIGLFNYMNYGAARIAIKRNSISNKAIMFNLNFGGGTNHSCGEDSLFLRDCLRSGLKIYAVNYSIVKLNDSESTWFNGYNEKYFFDKGCFLGVAHKNLCHLFAIYLVLRHKEYYKESNISKGKALKLIFNGIKEIKK